MNFVEVPGWRRAESNHVFFSGRISNAQRLPNGNTRINEGLYGWFFEVTANGEVWEYVNPFFGPATVPDAQPDE